MSDDRIGEQLQNDDEDLPVLVENDDVIMFDDLLNPNEDNNDDTKEVKTEENVKYYGYEFN